MPRRWAFYATGGGQPHDTGTLAWEGGSAAVVDVRGHGPVVWHTLEGDVPAVGARVRGTLDWERRYAVDAHAHGAAHPVRGDLQHVGAAVTGGNMEPLRARMDFEFGALPEGFGAEVAELVNAEIAADRPVEVSFWPRAERRWGMRILIRTKVNLIPESVTEIRVVDIVDLDRQADGGTHRGLHRGGWPLRGHQDRVQGKGQQAPADRTQRRLSRLRRPARRVRCAPRDPRYL